MTRSVLLAAASLILVPTLRADEDASIADGKWLLSFANPGNEKRLVLVKIETKDGKRVVAGAVDLKGETKATDLQADAKRVAFAADVTFDPRAPRRYPIQFEGFPSSKDPKLFLGAVEFEGRLYFAQLAPTEMDKLRERDQFAPVTMPATVQQLQLVRNAPFILQARLRQAKTDEEKAKLKEQIAEARKESEEKAPGLLRDVIAKDGDTQHAYSAAFELLRTAGKKSPKPPEVVGWAETIEKFAQPFGPKMRAEVATRLADVLAAQDGYGPIALKYAEKAVAAEQPLLTTHERALRTLLEVQERVKEVAAAKETAVRLARVKAQLDADYLQKMPPFKVEKFAGRKTNSNRVAVMELFTGAQCPPCVGADLAFDGLVKAYTPKDLILIQYHLHIPGSDPLTNPDTQARWTHYAKAFPQQIRGVPTSIFNGQPKHGGGGGMSDSVDKFGEYKAEINRILEQETPVTVNATAARKGDSLEIQAALGGIKDEDMEDVKLHVLVCEEAIGYVGGNGIRYHHHVVRSMPTGAAGVAVKGLEGKYKSTVDLADLRKSLTKYLDDHVAEFGPFANPDRPLALKDLRIIAFVQNDKTHEILQATEVEVHDAK